jgi:hypothetical protein
MQVTALVTIVFIAYAKDNVAFNPNFNVRLCVGNVYCFCVSIQFATITQFVNRVSLLRQKLKILTSYLASDENPTESATNNNLWDTLLQKPRFTNEANWKDDALHMEEFYQALNRRHYSNVIIQDSTSISTHNYWLHKEKLCFRALRVIWDVLHDVSSSVNSMYGL